MNFQEVFDLQPVNKLRTQESRRSDRIPKEIGILLIGWDAQGVEFMEQTNTVDLSRHGAGIVSTHKLAAEQELIIVHQENNKKTEIRVVGQIGCEGDSYTYGVAFLDPTVDFWGIAFPSASQVEILARRAVSSSSTISTRRTPGGVEGITPIALPNLVSLVTSISFPKGPPFLLVQNPSEFLTNTPSGMHLVMVQVG